MNCPNCNAENVYTFGRVSCMCDKDFCNGQRCGANDLAEKYKCETCGSEGLTPGYIRYMDRY